MLKFNRYRICSGCWLNKIRKTKSSLQKVEKQLEVWKILSILMKISCGENLPIHSQIIHMHRLIEVRI